MKAGTFLLICLASTLAGCEGEVVNGQNQPLVPLHDVLPSTWEKLSQQRIYFGHQSVGNNIMVGVEEVMLSNQSVSLQVQKLNGQASISRPVFAHEEIGENDFPLTKTKALRERLQGGLGDKLDIVFLKYCFWDIRSHTDVKVVFEDYKETIRLLRSQYPHITFVHFTIPLMAYQTGIIVSAKRLLHLPVEWDADNIKRGELNRLILDEYVGKEPVFDIAAIESTLPDGRRAFFVREGKQYRYLAHVYTKDGGHLNEVGRRIVAEQLLVLLAGVADTGNR